MAFHSISNINFGRKRLPKEPNEGKMSIRSTKQKNMHLLDKQHWTLSHSSSIALTNHFLSVVQELLQSFSDFLGISFSYFCVLLRIDLAGIPNRHK